LGDRAVFRLPRAWAALGISIPPQSGGIEMVPEAPPARSGNAARTGNQIKQTLGATNERSE